MVIKSAVMLSLVVVPMIIINSGFVQSIQGIFSLYILCGFGMAGIGMCVMHDANHGSYSKNLTVNKLMGLTMNLIGSNEALWKIQHNVLHHTYTNVHNADEDLKTPGLLRFSPHEKRRNFHRFQHYYVWFFYGVSTLAWVSIKDFVVMKRYRKAGLIKTDKQFRRTLVKVLAWKVVYYSYSLVLPIIILPLSGWAIFAAFITMHFVTGIALSIVFEMAHVIPGTDYPLPDKNGLIANDWAIHQMVTTSNFSPKSKVFSWFIGGLNYQIEHHLLPNICHVHYRKIAHIVKDTAKEFGVPYLIKDTFAGALSDHVKLLKELGAEPIRQNVAVIAPVKEQPTAA